MGDAVGKSCGVTEDLFETYSANSHSFDSLELFLSSALGFTKEGGSQEAAGARRF